MPFFFNSDRIFVFPCTSQHCMCLNCFIHYCQAMMNSELFRNFVDVGYSVSCPARGEAIGGCEGVVGVRV